ncbi:VOC family protein [Streptosporangium vulgare]|uniref:VOC family protein n=1 Tax=Streptosporangium vulgare TaxID=46190 RepID=A0ABV5TE33_9ACTN
MKTSALGSILFGSADPARLHAWYLAALEPEHFGDGFIDFGGVRVLFEARDDVAPATAEPGRVIFNFHVEDARATAAHLDGLGVTWLVEVERREAGLFGTLVDPDGNYLQIIELSQEYLAAARR